MTTVEPIFRSAREALVFALNFSAEQYDRPAMSKMAARATGSGRGLGGLDGAAQAGFVRQELAACGRLYEALIIAQLAPRGTPCACRAPCCSGTRPNRERAEAIDYLVTEAIKVLSGCVTHHRMRVALVEAALRRERPGITALAERCGVHRDTVSEHAKRVRRWLIGEREEIGLEQRAWEAITARLTACGMVGEPAAVIE